MHVHLSCLDAHRIHIGYTLDTRCHGVRSHGNTLSWKRATQRRPLARPANWRNVEEFVQESRKYCTNDKVTIYFFNYVRHVAPPRRARHMACPLVVDRHENETLLGGAW